MGQLPGLKPGPAVSILGRCFDPGRCFDSSGPLFESAGFRFQTQDVPDLSANKRISASDLASQAYGAPEGDFSAVRCRDVHIQY
jgi:hypothetical protein